MKRFHLYSQLLSRVREERRFIQVLAGPRQVGKTTIAQKVLKRWRHGGLYLNWDIPAHRKRLLSNSDLLATTRSPGKRPLVVFDELHKMRHFKNWLKGFYDLNQQDAAIWVTGSGRLDLYQKGGESLLGRYFLYHLFPLSVGEIISQQKNDPLAPDAAWAHFESEDQKPQDISSLMDLGGFPEPFLRQEKTFHKRWLLSRRERITHEDLRDLTRINDLDRLEFLIELINPRVGSPLSLNALREDLGVAFDTVRSWIAALERVYYVFGLRPYEKKIQRRRLRALKKINQLQSK